MRSIFRVFVVLSLFMSLSPARLSAAVVSPHAAGPTILKRTIEVSTYRFLRYWPNPSAREPQYNTWSWVPRVSFELLGPVPGGSQWYVDFQTPEGKPWISYKCQTDELQDDVSGKVQTP